MEKTEKTYEETRLEQAREHLAYLARLEPQSEEEAEDIRQAMVAWRGQVAFMEARIAEELMK